MKEDFYQIEEEMCKRICKKEVVYIVWSPTNCCFLECPYCYSHSQQVTEIEKNIPIDIWERMKQLARNKEVCLKLTGGGEPFSIKAIKEVLNFIPKDFICVIDTNGLLISDDKWLKRLNPNSIVNISCHYAEMKEKKVLDRWLKNVQAVVKNIKDSVMITLVAYPVGLGEEFNEALIFAKKSNCPVHIKPLVNGSNSLKDWPKIWPTAQHRKWYTVYKDKNYTWKGQRCLAGESIFTVKQGNVYSCTSSKEKIGELYPNFILPDFKSGICSFKRCACPIQGFYGTMQNKVEKRFL